MWPRMAIELARTGLNSPKSFSIGLGRRTAILRLDPSRENDFVFTNGVAAATTFTASTREGHAGFGNLSVPGVQGIALHSAKPGSVNYDPRTQPHPISEFFYLFVGECNAAVGPVGDVMDAAVAVADAVNTDVTTKGRVLRRQIPLEQGAADGVIRIEVDELLPKRQFGLLMIRIVEAKK